MSAILEIIKMITSLGGSSQDKAMGTSMLENTQSKMLSGMDKGFYGHMTIGKARPGKKVDICGNGECYKK